MVYYFDIINSDKIWRIYAPTAGFLLTNIFCWHPLRINTVLVLMRDVVVVGDAVGLPVDVLLEAECAFWLIAHSLLYFNRL